MAGSGAVPADRTRFSRPRRRRGLGCWPRSSLLRPAPSSADLLRRRVRRRRTPSRRGRRRRPTIIRRGRYARPLWGVARVGHCLDGLRVVAPCELSPLPSRAAGHSTLAGLVRPEGVASRRQSDPSAAERAPTRPAGPRRRPARRRAEPPATAASTRPPTQWDDWVEWDAEGLAGRRSRTLHARARRSASTANRPAACSPTSTRTTWQIRKFEGNPLHPGSRGRNCAKGPATLNQINDPERILYPLKRVGKRGEGKWERVTWEEALDDIGGAHPQGVRRGDATTRSSTTSAGRATTA